MGKTLSQTGYINIEQAESKGYLAMDAEDIYMKVYNKKTEVEDPIFSKEVIYAVKGEIYNEECCSELDIYDAKREGWSHCPYCGEQIIESIFETYKTESEAEKSEYFEEIGISCFLAVKAISRNPDINDRLFL